MKKLQSRRKITQFTCSINTNCCIINKKRAYTISQKCFGTIRINDINVSIISCYSKENLWIGNDINNFQWRNGWYPENNCFISGLLIKSVSETTKNEAKERNEGFLVMILGTLAAGILGNALTGKGVIRANKGAIARSWDQGTIRSGQDF